MDILLTFSFNYSGHWNETISYVFYTDDTVKFYFLCYYIYLYLKKKIKICFHAKTII